MAAEDYAAVLVHNADPIDSAKNPRGWKGWRRSILFGAITSATALLTNVAVLAWAVTRHHFVDGNGNSYFDAATNTVLIYEGTQRKMKYINAGLHALITVFSSLLLAGGNACMQVMIAPSRDEVKAAHSRGRWLDIGVSGIKNLRAVSWKRKFAWGMTAVSCFPLHLVYNSVIFTTTVASNYAAAMVTNDFPTGAPFDVTADGSLDITTGNKEGTGYLYHEMQHNISALKHLDNTDCIKIFGADFLTDYLNVLLVTNVTSSGNSILGGWQVSSAPFWSDDMNFRSDLGWICGNQNAPCDIGRQISNADTWTLPRLNAPNGEFVKVEYCLAQPFHGQANVLLSIPLLATVVATNGVQLIFVLWALLMRDLDPLITTGDAIASFMAEPDPTTRGLGTLSVLGLRKGHWTRSQYTQVNPSTWRAQQYRWCRAISLRRWLITIASCLFIWGLGVALLATGLSFNYNYVRQPVSFHTLLKAGFGAILPESLVGFIQSFNEIGLVITANIPQLLISVLYYLYNGIFTCMVSSHEYNSYASQTTLDARLAPKHKPRFHNLPLKMKNFVLRRPQPLAEDTNLTPQAAGLRVSSCRGPTGAQRSTYFLNLPFRYAIPLLLASTSLHFFASQSIFLARVLTVDNDGSLDPNVWINGCAWSALALVITLIIGAGMVLSIIGFGLFRKFREGMPLAGSCSAVISAHCHTVADNDLVDHEAPRWAVSYGDLGPVSEADLGVRKAGFGPGRVYQLAEGQPYV